MHQPEIMLRMLMAVLRFDRITRKHGGSRERHVALVARPNIGRTVGSIPSQHRTAARIRQRTPAVLSRSEASHGYHSGRTIAVGSENFHRKPRPIYRMRAVGAYLLWPKAIDARTADPSRTITHVLRCDDARGKQRRQLRGTQHATNGSGHPDRDVNSNRASGCHPTPPMGCGHDIPCARDVDGATARTLCCHSVVLAGSRWWLAARLRMDLRPHLVSSPAIIGSARVQSCPGRVWVESGSSLGRVWVWAESGPQLGGGASSSS